MPGKTDNQICCPKDANCPKYNHNVGSTHSAQAFTVLTLSVDSVLAWPADADPVRFGGKAQT